MGLVALTENLILLQFEFCIDYDAEDGGKVLLKCNDVECVSIDVKEKYIKPTRVFELEDGVGIYRNRRR